MTTSPKLRIALVGCGQIADAHLQELRKIPTADVVAVCDRQIDLARQAAARFDVPSTFDDMIRMIQVLQAKGVAYVGGDGDSGHDYWHGYVGAYGHL